MPSQDNVVLPMLFLFAGSNGAGKTTFARSYLTPLPGPPRFLNADEMERAFGPQTRVAALS
jgi:predicted ABC-type ATPase